MLVNFDTIAGFIWMFFKAKNVIIYNGITPNISLQRRNRDISSHLSVFPRSAVRIDMLGKLSLIGIPKAGVSLHNSGIIRGVPKSLESL